MKKSASVVAKDSALIVTVLTCFSSASVFSRVLMAPLKTVSASAASWHFFSYASFASTFACLSVQQQQLPVGASVLGRVWEGFVDEFDADWLKHNIGYEEPDPAGESTTHQANEN